MSFRRCFCLAVLVAALTAGVSFAATTYEVGDGKSYTSIGAVPWESLNAGDTVLIYWRSTPYKEKWVICRQGTSAAPITVRGVAGPSGQFPQIDGNGATTRLALDYWNETRGVLKIGGASVPADTTPQYIIIDSLEIFGARPPNTFTDDAGNPGMYDNNAAAVYVEKGQHLTIRNCVLHDCGNGLFIGPNSNPVTGDVLVERNYIYSNGNVGSAYEHNTYTEAIGITYQYNRFGPLLSGAQGNSLKDRSAGLMVRYNWLEGGNRELDLVDADGTPAIVNDPSYHTTFVYGNVIIEPAGDGNKQLTHYGGDSGVTASYRKGTLYFYCNTCVSNRTDSTTLFRLSTNEEHCDARDNVFYAVAAGNSVALLDQTGVLDLTHNWFKPGYRSSFSTLLGTINDDGTSVTGSAPGFVNEAGQDYHLAPASACIDAATALNGAVLPANNVTQQYVKHQAGEPRPNAGAFDLGGFELIKAGDINRDGQVDLTDVAILIANYGLCAGAAGFNPQADLDGNGCVDLTDLAILISHFGT